MVDSNKNDNNNNNDREEEDDDRSVAEVLIDLATENFNLFFKDQYETPWVRVSKDGHYELIRIASDKFKRYLSQLYYINERRAPNTEALLSAVSILRARAEFDGRTIPLSLRVASYDNAIFYDLTNENWQCVKITKQDWEIINSTSDPLFMRYNNTPQVYPSREYPSYIRDRFLRLINLKRDDDKILLIVYIISLFIPEIQHVALQLHGGKGSAKSMLQKFIKLLADPAIAILLSVHNDRMQFIQQIAHNHLVYYDNLKYIPEWLSDEVCRGITGAGSSKRVLYTDDEDHTYSYKRCFGFNGINLVLTEPDVLDRSIIIEQETIKSEDRISEEEMLSRFYDLRPQLLGYIFDILVKAQQIRPTINLRLLPRMGDFALWGEAIARAMGYKELDFIRVYNDNTERQNVEAIDNHVLGHVILRFLNDLPKVEINNGPCWIGTTSEFLDVLNTTAINEKININAKGWPKAANSLARKLKTIVSNIKEGLGFEISITRDTTKGHKGISVIEIREIPSPSSPSSPGQNQARNGAQNGEDISNSEDTMSSPEYISSPEKGEITHENGASEGSEGSEDIFPVSYEGVNDSYRCYHNGCKCRHTCDFQTDNKEEYEKHGALKHRKNPLLYPSKSEINKYGLEAQRKPWEK